MADPEPPRRPALARVRLASSQEVLAAPVADLPGMDPALERILEALELSGLARPQAAATLVQRLGDPRTLALLAAADAGRIGALVGDAVRLSDATVRHAAKEEPENQARRLDFVRSAGPLRIGQILLAQGLVAPRRLEEAIEAQKDSKRKVGEELVAGGHLVVREVAEALWLQHKLVATALALVMAEPSREAAPVARLILGARAP